MKKKAAILITLLLAILWTGMHMDNVQKQLDVFAEKDAAFCSTTEEKPLPLNYGGLMAVMPDMPCDHHHMQSKTGISTSRTSSLRNQRRLFKQQCAQFTRISNDRLQTAYVVSETMKAIGHHCHSIIRTTCCMRC